MALTKIDNLQSLHMRYDLAIIGAGPAEMAAATEAAAIGVRAVLFDENPAIDGQIYRAIETNTPAKRAFLGKDYWKGKQVLEAFLASDATYVPQSLVWSVEQQQADDGPLIELRVSALGQSRIIHARRVIFATGAMERSMPLKGWTLPGVMTIGAAQIALKSSGLVPEGRIVLAGTGPLLYLFAAPLSRKSEDVLPLWPHAWNFFLKKRPASRLR